MMKSPLDIHNLMDSFLDGHLRQMGEHRKSVKELKNIKYSLKDTKDMMHSEFGSWKKKFKGDAYGVKSRPEKEVLKEFDRFLSQDWSGKS